MGKKKNLTKDSCDNGPVLTQPVTSPPLKAVNCNGNSDCKGSNTQTNGLIYEPDESQSVNHVNGTDCDDDAPSDTTNQLNSHTNQFLSSHDSEGDTRVVNGTVDEISVNVSSLKIDSESSQNSCSSRTVVSPSLADQVSYVVYESELQMPDIMRLIQKDLSEPYSIYTYRYFIHNWPHLCFMARVDNECVGAIVCKLDFHKKIVKRGYIAMLAVDSSQRKRKIGSTLVKKAIQAMIAEEADEVVLETEITNKPALRLYENLGFVRDKRLFRYYLNGVDALRLKLWLR